VTEPTSQGTTSDDPVYVDHFARRWNSGDPGKGSIVLVHGLAEHSGRYERTGTLLADAGFRVAAPDLYGFGLSGGIRGDVRSWEDYWDQIESLISESEDQSGPTVLLGHSLGGLLCAGYVLSDRPRPDLLVLSAPALGGGAAWQKALAPVLARLLPKVMVPNTIKGSQLSRDGDVGEAYFADPLVVTKTSARLGAYLFDAQDYVNQNLSSWTLPTLVMHGGADTIVPPASTLVLADVPGVERRIYPKLRHEIFNEPEGPELITEIVDWLGAQTPA